MERVRFKGLHSLLPCLAITFPVNLVLGLVHLVMPIHHGQQLAGQPFLLLTETSEQPLPPRLESEKGNEQEILFLNLADGKVSGSAIYWGTYFQKNIVIVTIRIAT